uniref:Probable cytosolic iron-sulfur protein assembly protein CIAO1 homolog n=1 Tax=Babesia bovis TaxID=5865 RepID=S6B7P4_BABBO|nr:WD domain, G-beta repeat containing protein [Babesia bovis]
MDVHHLSCVKGHSERIWSVCWSPVDDIFATCSSDCSVKIWRITRSSNSHVKKGHLCSSYDPGCCSEYNIELEASIDNYFKKTVRSVRFSNDGAYLICASFDGTATIWSRVPQKSGGSDVINSCSSNIAYLWSCVCVLEGHENEVKCASFDCTGTYVATCGRDKTIWIHQRSSSTPGDTSDIVRSLSGTEGSIDFYCAAILTSHSQDVKCVSWSPTALLLVSGSYDNSIRLWGLVGQDWSCIQTINIHASTVWSISFDVDGTRFAAVSADRSLSLFKSSKAAAYLEQLNATQRQVSCPSAIMKLSPLDTRLSHELSLRSQAMSSYQLSNPLIADDWQPFQVIESYSSRALYSVNFCKFVITGGGDNTVRIMYPGSNASSQRIEFRAHNSDVNGVCGKPMTLAIYFSPWRRRVHKVGSWSHRY